MHIGMIVGIGPAATDFYYRSLIRRMADQSVALELTMVHADAPTLLRNQEAGQTMAQVEIYEKLTRRLKAAGASAVAVTSVAGHFCIDDFAAVSSLPIISLLGAVTDHVSTRQYRTVALLGTRGAMESKLYNSLGGVEVITPDPDALSAVHDAYVSLSRNGVCTDQQRDVFFEAGQAMVSQRGAEAILLAGTDLVLAFDGQDPGFPVVDCASVHVAAIAATASE